MGVPTRRNLVERFWHLLYRLPLNLRIPTECLQQALALGDQVLIINTNSSSDFRREISCKGFVVGIDSVGITVYMYAPLNDTFKLLYMSHKLGWEIIRL